MVCRLRLILKHLLTLRNHEEEKNLIMFFDAFLTSSAHPSLQKVQTLKLEGLKFVNMAGD